MTTSPPEPVGSSPAWPKGDRSRRPTVIGFDHAVLIVADVEASLRWYTECLGLVAERAEEWRRGEVLFPSLRVDDSTVLDLLVGDPTGENVDHLCLVVVDIDLDALVDDPAWGETSGPHEVWGARGTGRSIYVRDPDGHRIELRTYPGERP